MSRPPPDEARPVTTRLTLLCHAPTAATREVRFPADEGIDAGGAARAEALFRAGAARAGRRLAAPERRARETAAGLGPDFAVDGALRDQGFGRWAGSGVAAVAAAEPDALAAWMADPESVPSGGESRAALIARVSLWMDGQAALGGRAVAVAHPAVVRAAAVAALGAGPGTFWRLEASPLTAASFSHDGRRWTLAALVPPD